MRAPSPTGPSSRERLLERRVAMLEARLSRYAGYQLASRRLAAGWRAERARHQSVVEGLGAGDGRHVGGSEPLADWVRLQAELARLEAAAIGALV